MANASGTLPRLISLQSLAAVALLSTLLADAAAAAVLAVCEGDGDAAVLSAGRDPVAVTVTDEPPASDTCLVQTLPVAASAVRWFSLSDLPLRGSAPAVLSLQGWFDDHQASISEVIWTRPSALPQPAPPALAEIKLDPAVASVPRGRAGWLWSPGIWQQSPDQVWTLAREQNLTRIYLSIPVTDTGSVANAAGLAAFITAARARGLDVWAVIGDPRDVLAEQLPALLARSAAYLDYNTTVAPAAALGGLQLDIEPYLLPGFALAQDHWRERYLATVQAVHAALGQQLALDLVLPVWWGVHPAWSDLLLAGLGLPGLSLTIMNYRTDASRLRNDARPFLAWAQREGVALGIALELGSVGPDESRWTYTSTAGEGELWLLSAGGHGVLVLFEVAQAGLSGRVWRKVNEIPVPATNITFAGDMEQLQATIVQLEQEWLRWSAYSGIALHGLEEIYLRP